MGLFRKRSEAPSGVTPLGEDHVLIPEDEMPEELRQEGQEAITIRDEWMGRRGKFIGLDASGVEAAAEAKLEGQPYGPDQRGLVLELMNDPAYWASSSGDVIVCQLDPVTGKLLAGPALVDMVMKSSSFHLTDFGEGPSIGLNRESVTDEVYERIQAMGGEITEEEHMALTYEVMDDPAHWTGPDDDSPDDDVPRFSFYPFDPTTGRIDRD